MATIWKLCVCSRACFLYRHFHEFYLFSCYWFFSLIITGVLSTLVYSSAATVAGRESSPSIHWKSLVNCTGPSGCSLSGCLDFACSMKGKGLRWCSEYSSSGISEGIDEKGLFGAWWDFPSQLSFNTKLKVYIVAIFGGCPGIDYSGENVSEAHRFSQQASW